MRRFAATITTYVEIDVSDGILAIVDYGTPAEIAAFLADQYALHNREVDNIDGFADRSRDEVRLGRVDSEAVAREVRRPSHLARR